MYPKSPKSSERKMKARLAYALTMDVLLKILKELIDSLTLKLKFG